MELERYAERIDGAVARELTAARLLADQCFYTEASVRLGCAVEAAIYSTARELGLDLTNRHIADLTRIQESVRAAQVKLIRNPSPEHVRGLSNIIKRLAESIAYLSQDANRRIGTLDQNPRPTQQLFREFVQRTNSAAMRRRIEEEEGRLRKIQNTRNRAAHASLDGCPREISMEEYDLLIQDAQGFVTRFLDLRVGLRAASVWQGAERTDR